MLFFKTCPIFAVEAKAKTAIVQIVIKERGHERVSDKHFHKM